MRSEIRTVGVIGLGNMGSGMAASLVRAGFSVLGLDRVAESVDRARRAGVQPSPDLGSLARSSDAVISVLPDSPDVEACLLGEDGVRTNAHPGTLVIDCSTVAPATTDRVARELSAAGLEFVDAAMGRSPAQAETGNLLFMVGGDGPVLTRARPVLEAMGDEIHHCGGVGTGIRTKLVMNLLSQSTCQLSAEAVALGLKMGLERDTLLAVLSGGLGANGFITKYWPTKVLVGDTEPGFAIRLSAKDLRYAVAMAEQAGAPVPTAAAAAKAVNRAAVEHGDLDVSGLLTVACANAGAKL